MFHRFPPFSISLPLTSIKLSYIFFDVKTSPAMVPLTTRKTYTVRASPPFIFSFLLAVVHHPPTLCAHACQCVTSQMNTSQSWMTKIQGTACHSLQTVHPLHHRHFLGKGE